MKHLLVSVLFLTIILSCSKDDESKASGANSSTTSVSTSNTLPAGQSANGLLSNAKFQSTVVEVVYVSGNEPQQASIDNFVNFLEERTNKPNGISVQKREITSPGLSPYSFEDLVNVEANFRTLFSSESQIAVWAFFADGASSSNTSTGTVLGTAYRNTSFVIYEETIQDLSDEPLEPSRELLETTVILHEFGHLLGLTNLGTPLQTAHEDTTHPKHCDVDTCLMFWKAETGSGVIDLISGGTVPSLDGQCIADLRANGGR